jgi:hypothetical protein
MVVTCSALSSQSAVNINKINNKRRYRATQMTRQKTTTRSQENGKVGCGGTLLDVFGINGPMKDAMRNRRWP